MAFYDRGKESRKKSNFYGSKDKDDKFFNSRRLPIILTKPDSERDKDKDKGSKSRSSTQDSSEKSVPSQPTILLKTREGDGRALSPSQKTARQKKDVEPTYQLATKTSNTDTTSSLLPLPEMKQSIKLIDENCQFCGDGLLEYLSEQTDFLVIGCIGPQSAGKSTIMSHLTSTTPTNWNIFKPQTIEQEEVGLHGTNGVDVFVTSNRVILLDTQPILSPSVLDKLIQQDNKKSLGNPGPPNHNAFSSMNDRSATPTTEFGTVENAVEINSLQITGFLLSVCHTVICIQDWFFDPNVFRFLQSAEMLKPATTTLQDDVMVEYFPQVVFLQNKARVSDFNQENISTMQDVINQTFLRSRLQIQSGVGIATGNVIKHLNPMTCGDPINLYLLPNFYNEENPNHFKNNTGFADLMLQFKRQLLGITKHPLTHTALTEKNWFHYASKVWDGIKKSPFYSEYSRLLP
ncbi:unnamed protein product [Bemisia tabaci]|uniref:Protein SMG9 n=1 Tax=Bemisia tabaci TaxID=7038 RepID=A0A9P0AL70_BEMTA|nr:unnamed protein product [Bemisia tabaci]